MKTTGVEAGATAGKRNPHQQVGPGESELTLPYPVKQSSYVMYF
jgi:hypothetical protein